MTSNWTYTITHYDESNSWSSTNITDYLVSIPYCTDTGTGEVNTARIILSADRGKFIKTSPVIDQFDRIRIQIDDGDSSTTNYDKYYDVTKILPSESKSQGTRVELYLLGLEHHLQQVNYTKSHFSEGPYEVVEDICNLYNISKGNKQPTIQGHNSSTYNKLPNSSYIKNNYDFGEMEKPCLDRIVEVTESLGAAVDDGGVLDFYDIRFDYIDHENIRINVFSQGNNIADGSQIQITNTESVNVGETDSGIDEETGSQVLAWGAPESGSLPVAYSKFASEEVRFNLYPEWSSTIEYGIGAKVRYQGTLYKRQNSIVSLPASPPTSDANWLSRTKAQDYGDLYYVSYWTSNASNGAENAKDSGTDPSNINSSSELGPGFNDGNIVVWDTDEDANWFRTWVDVRVTGANPQPSTISSDATLQKYLYSDTYFYRGFRALLENTASSGVWSGTDSNNNSYSKAIVECVTPGNSSTATWKVKYTPSSNLSVIVRHEGIPYRYTGSAWSASGSGYGANTDGDCLHPYTSLTNEDGIYDGVFSLQSDSAIKIRYQWTTNILGLVSDATEQHAIGAWFNMTFPFPHSSIVTGTPVVGNHYGGAFSGRDSVCEPATLDIENMHLSPTGNRGFNQTTDETECLGPISSIDFWLKLHYQGTDNPLSSYNTLAEANFVMTCLLIDTSDNVVKQDFVVPFNNTWTPIKLPIGGFQTYRGRKPRESILSSITPPRELTINNQIEWRNIKQIIIQTAQSYDSHGRYAKSALDGNFYANGMTTVGLIPTGGQNSRRLDMYIDAFRFTKPLLVTSATAAITDRNIESEFMDKTEIYDYFQLKNIAKAELEKRQHRHVEFEITTTGNFSIPFGNFFKFIHERIISDGLRTGTVSGVNYVKLVAKNIEYSITKPVDGKGGFLRKLLGVKRFE